MLQTLGVVLTLRQAASLIEGTARWISPETFKFLPLRLQNSEVVACLKRELVSAQMNKNRASRLWLHKSKENVHDNKAQIGDKKGRTRCLLPCRSIAQTVGEVGLQRARNLRNNPVYGGLHRKLSTPIAYRYQGPAVAAWQ